MTMLQIATCVDARGLSCPMPIVKTAQAMKAVASGEPDRGPRDRSGLRQGLRGMGADDGQRARRAVSRRRRLPLRPAPKVRHAAMTTTTLERPATVALDPLAIAIADVEGLPEIDAEPPSSRRSETKELVIVNWSGDLDKVWPVLILSSTAAASGVRCRVFVTFWGLLPFVKDQKRIVGENWMQKMLTLMQRPGIDHLKLSKMNFLGMGPWMMGVAPQEVRRREPARAARGGHRPGRGVHPLPDDDGHVRPQARGPHRRDGRARRRRHRDRDHDRGRRLAVHLGRTFRHD